MADDEQAMRDSERAAKDPERTPGNREPARSASDTAARLRLLVRRAAWTAATLTFLVIVASAFMRHTQAGLSCDDWPNCYGRIEAAAQGDGSVAAVAASAGVRAARLLHRFAATGVLALVIGLLLVAWTQRPVWKRQVRFALAALAIAGGLAALGVATPGAQIPAVTLGNLLGGFLLLAMLTALAASVPADPRVVRGSSRAGPLVFAALALLFAQSALGGTIGAQYALMACPTMGSCPGIPFDPFIASGALDPFRPLASSAGRVVPPADAAAVHVLHRVLGIVVVLLVLLVAYLIRRTDRAASRLLVAGTLVAPLSGAVAILAMPSLPFTVVHNAAAALTIAALAAVAARR